MPSETVVTVDSSSMVTFTRRTICIVAPGGVRSAKDDLSRMQRPGPLYEAYAPVCNQHRHPSGRHKVIKLQSMRIGAGVVGNMGSGKNPTILLACLTNVLLCEQGASTQRSCFSPPHCTVPARTALHRHPHPSGSAFAALTEASTST